MRARHWTERWIGWRYEEGSRECGDFVAMALEREFGRRIVLPRASTLRDRDRLVAAHLGELARPLDRPPAEGDGVLMRARGRRAVGHHIGLWCAPDGEPSVLHAIAALGGVLHPLAGLHVAGLEVVGLYAWRSEGRACR